ncbi:MAG: serine/threonine-protein kinase [Planctomycetota bacterium]
MSPDRNDLQLAALMVHRGYLDGQVGRKVAQRVAAGEDLQSALQAEGLPAERALWLVETRAGQQPRIPGFDVGRRLGQGGTAEVFEALERKTGRQIVIKILMPLAAHQRGTLKAFVEEGKRLAELQIQGLVRGFGVARFGEVVFSKQERLKGRTLQEVLDEQGQLPEARALSIVLQVAETLGRLARQGLVHRDVKPGNIIVDGGDRATLIDLGFCAGVQEKCNSGQAVGTAEYLSPEQAMGGAQADIRSDIYSLGVTLFQLTVGRLPFEGRQSEEVLRQHVMQSLRSPELQGRGVSPSVQYLIEKMMAKDADIRFQNYDELIAEVRGLIEGQKRLDFTQGQRPAPPRSARPRRRR